MKKFTRIPVTLFLLAFMALVFVSCEKDDADKKVLKFSPSTVEIAVDSTAKVNVSGGLTPYVAVSSDTTFVKTTVDKSVISIKGKAKGKTIISVTDKDKVSGKITVTVK